MMKEMITAVILNYNDAKTTINLVKIIEMFDVIDNILVVDNKSTDTSMLSFNNALFGNKVVVVEAEKNGGYGYGNNIGIRISKQLYNSEYTLICNPDVIFDESTVIELKAFLDNHPEYTIVAPRMKNAKGDYVNSYWDIPSAIDYVLFSLYFVGRAIRKKKQKENQGNLIETECIAGSFLFARTNELYNTALYDEKIFLYCEETVQGIKIKNAGYRVCILSNQSFIHNHSVSINKSIPKEIDRYKIQWKSRLYVLEEYYGLSTLQIWLSKAVMEICVLERYLLSIKKRLSEALFHKNDNN